MTDVAARRISIAVALAAIAMMWWHLFAPSEPTPYDPRYNFTWGVSFYSQLPFAFQILGFFALPAALAWAAFAPLNPESRSTPSSQPNTLWRWLPLLLALLGALLFAAFPVAYSEGDSALFNNLSPKRLIFEPEPLDYYLKIKLYSLLSPLLTLRTDAFQIVAVIAGFFYVPSSFLLASRLARNRRKTLVYLCGLLSVANIIFFFRYIEDYALVTVASVLLLWACIRYVNGAVPLALVAAIAMITALFHGSGLFWLPTIIAAWILRAKQAPLPVPWPRAFKEAMGASLVALAIFAAFVTVIVIDGYTYAQFQDKIDELGGKGSGMFIPLLPHPGMTELYAFFSWSHFGAIIQQQLLVAPMALVTIIIVIAASRHTLLALARHNPELILLSIASLTLFLYSIFWNADLGARNDWDLFALPAIPLTLLALYLLLQLPGGKPKRIAITAYLTITAIHTLAWLLLHIRNITY